MTKRELKNIWRVPKYLPYVQPELTDEILENAEKQIGFKLPAELIEILKIQNGGYVRYKLSKTPHEQIRGIGPYFPSLTDVDWTDFKEYMSFGLDGLVPIDGDGHWYICLDYRENKLQPKISWIDVECDNQEKIADTFAEFIKLLELDINGEELIIETENPVEEIAKQLENILHIRFDEPDDFAHGYLVYRSKYKDSWVWLTPNKVHLGFVREEDDRYNELKAQMNSYSLQYPEIGETCLFLEISNKELNNEVIANLTENGMTINPITKFIQLGKK